jgi:hypothetical protein
LALTKALSLPVNGTSLPLLYKRLSFMMRDDFGISSFPQEANTIENKTIRMEKCFMSLSEFIQDDI